jgi:hypothetical protein
VFWSCIYLFRTFRKIEGEHPPSRRQEHGDGGLATIVFGVLRIGPKHLSRFLLADRRPTDGDHHRHRPHGVEPRPPLQPERRCEAEDQPDLSRSASLSRTHRQGRWRGPGIGGKAEVLALSAPAAQRLTSLVGWRPCVDFRRYDTAPTADLAGEEDRRARSLAVRVTPSDSLGNFNLTTRRFCSLLGVLRVGSGKRDQQRRHRFPIAAFVLLRVGRENPAEIHAVELRSSVVACRVGRHSVVPSARLAKPLKRTHRRRAPTGCRWPCRRDRPGQPRTPPTPGGFAPRGFWLRSTPAPGWPSASRPARAAGAGLGAAHRGV